MNKAIIVGRGRDKATQRIEITDPSVSREHCILTDNGDGTYTLEHKGQLPTYVDGVQILKTQVTRDSVITIGKSTKVKVADLLPLPLQGDGGVQDSHSGEKTVKPQPQPQPNPYPQYEHEYSIAHLEEVWKTYHQGTLDIQNRQHSMGLLIRIPTIFTIGGGVLTAVVGPEFRVVTIIMSIIGLILMVYGIIQSKNFKPAEVRDKLDQEFQDTYVCPKCHHFMGNMPYKLLRQDKNCRFCKCKLHD